MALSKGFRVFEKNNPPVYSVILEQRNKPDALMFESHAVALLSSTEQQAIKKQYVKLLDAYGCLGVLQINAGNSPVMYLVLVTGCFSVGKIGEIEIFRVTQTHFLPLQYQLPTEDRAAEIRKLLNSGTFYFSWANTSGPTQSCLSNFDITLCLQKINFPRKLETDNRFFWNRMLHIHLLRFGIDCSTWLLKVMCGSVEIRTVYCGASQARCAIISRLSCERTGTRFNVRGINDDGHVANFVETEQFLVLDGDVSSYIQTRGSVPTFFEQTGVQVGSHKVRMSRGISFCRRSFDAHMKYMKQRYGQITVINLLGTSLIGSKEGEATLSVEFQKLHQESGHVDIPHVVFDYHQECRGGHHESLYKLKDRVTAAFDDFGMFLLKNGKIIRYQRGVFRVNCLDCLDRTNCVQTFFGLEVLKEQIEQMGMAEKKQNFAKFEEVFRQMWINNGNEISKIYAGTGAIQGTSKLIDGARSAARTIQNNLLDNPKQEAIDLLLIGSTLSTELADRARILLPPNLLHAPTFLLRELCSRYPQYTTQSTLRVAVGTYNVNGGKHFRSVAYKDVSLSDWLLDSHKNFKEQSLTGDMQHATDDRSIDMFAVGFQEIVDLNASNIMAASTENAKQWAEELERVLSCREEKYCLVTSTQLVGVCLYVFVKAEHSEHIRDVAIDSVKTGLGGATGNKGAVAIRFVYKATSLCFVCSHFAAGQNQVAERNADFNEITRKMMFPMGRTLKSHDYVFWGGDFNYRIDMDKEELKEALRNNEIIRVLQNDQLKKQQEVGGAFGEYCEGDIDFHPTYKYDLFSDDYDTSEKARAPAWCDRVLWKRRKHIAESNESWSPGRVVHYGRSELKQSDHRPVIAIIDVDVAEVVPDLRQQVINEVIESMGPPDCTIIATVLNVLEGGEDEQLFSESTTNTIIQELSNFGEIILVRFVDDSMWVTFREGHSALSAAAKKKAVLCGLELGFELRTENWLQEFHKEIALCSQNTVALTEYDTGDYNTVGIPEVRPSSGPRAPNRPPPPRSPARPPPMNRGGDNRPPPIPPSPQHNLPNNTLSNQQQQLQQDQDDDAKSAIYEEIKEPTYQTPAPPVDNSNNAAPPPIPQRNAPQPPAQSPPQQQAPPLPTGAPPVLGSNGGNNGGNGSAPPIPSRANLPPVPPRNRQ